MRKDHSKKCAFSDFLPVRFDGSGIRKLASVIRKDQRNEGHILPGGAAGRTQGGVRTPHAVKAGIIAASIAASLFKNDMISYLPGNRSTVLPTARAICLKEHCWESI